MARTLPLLEAAQRRELDSPPKFTLDQRQLFFSLPEWAEPILRAMSAAHIRGGFLLQLVYFKASGRFFTVDRMRYASTWARCSPSNEKSLKAKGLLLQMRLLHQTFNRGQHCAA